MLKFFKIIAILEGISFILLLINMIFIKKLFPNVGENLVFPIGMAHGALFIGYIILAVLLKYDLNWEWSKFWIIILGSIIPFGTFYVEKKYL